MNSTDECIRAGHKSQFYMKEGNVVALVQQKLNEQGGKSGAETEPALKAGSDQAGVLYRK